MLFQLLKDEDDSSRAEGIVVIHSPRDTALLAFSAILSGFGALCLFYAQPRHVGMVLAFASFCAAVVALFFGGLSTKVLFRRDLRRMDVNWLLFGLGLISHSHPYSDVELFVNSVVTGGSSRWVSNSRGIGYYAKVGVAGYFLVYPGSVPVDDDRLREIRRELGFPGPVEGQRGEMPDET
jgi:hypothetical protein